MDGETLGKETLIVCRNGELTREKKRSVEQLCAANPDDHFGTYLNDTRSIENG